VPGVLGVWSLECLECLELKIPHRLREASAEQGRDFRFIEESGGKWLFDPFGVADSLSISLL